MELDIRPGSPNKIERTLAVDGIREPAATETFRAVLTELKDGRTATIHAFDIGANVGYFALLEANILGAQGEVYAVEAEPDNADRLEQNIERNEYTNIEVRQVAVGAERTRLELSLGSSSNLHQMSEVLGETDAGETVEVDVYPLDSLIAEYGIPEDEVIIVRMDVEGYEARVFEGMRRLLTGDRPVYLFAEIHPIVGSVDATKIAETLEENGFTPEYLSFDGGNTYRQMDSLEELKRARSNTHIMASRLGTETSPGRARDGLRGGE
ncbi:MAG: FkbM family methyltransferase [Halovenus sp.]